MSKSENAAEKAGRGTAMAICGRAKQVLLVTASLIGLSSPVFAQERPAEGAENASEGSEIIVTANKREQRLTDVGSSVAVIGGEALATRSIVSSVDLQNVVPGLSVGYSGYATPIYSLRGVGVNEPSIGSGSSVAVYVDEVPLTLPVMGRGSTLDLERVEVVKGPQGTLYGQNATGGAINYIAAKPTDDLRVGISGTYGRYNQTSLEGYISGPLSEGLRARLAIRSDRTFDGWQQSVSRQGDRLGEVRKLTGRFILQADPADRLSLTINANGWIDKSDTQAPQLVQFVGVNGNGTPASLAWVRAAPALLAPLNQPDTRTLVLPNSPNAADWDQAQRFRFDDWFWQGSVRADFELSDQITLTSITAYMRTRVNSNQDNDGMGTSLLPGTSLGLDINHSSYRNQARTRTFSQELRMAVETDNFTWVVGANYLNEQVTDIVVLSSRDFPSLNNLPGGGFTAATSGGTTRIESYGVFTNLDLRLTDELRISGGVRISGEKRQFAGCSRDSGDGRAAATFNTIYGLTGTANQILPGACYSIIAPRLPGLFQATLQEDNAPWNVNINYKPTPRSLIYGRISRGFKSGNFPTILAVNSGAFLPVRQESLLAYEFGAKFDVSGIASIEGAVFYYDYTDKQQRGREDTGPPFGLIAKQVNVPQSRIQGAELSVSLRPLPGLTLSASGSYLDSEIQTFTGFDIDAGTGDQSGGPLPFVSKYNLNIDVNYRMPLSDSVDLFVGGNMAYRSGSTSQISASPRWDLNAYTTFDAQLGISGPDDRWRAWIWGKNLTDELYWNNVIKSAEVVARFPSMGRTYGLTVSYKFQ